MSEMKMQKLAPTSRSIALAAVIVTSETLSFLTIVLRFIARRRAGAGYKTDDSLIIVAWVLSIAFAGPLAAGLWYGGGHHITELPPPNIVYYLKTTYIFTVLHAPTLYAVKLSILFLYLRINPSRHFRYIVYAVMAVALAIMTATTFASAFQCTPPQYFWTRQGEGHCFSIRKFYIAAVTLHMLTDFVIFFMPVRMVWRLQLSARKRIGLSAAFLIGLITCAISVVRLSQMDSVASEDPTHDNFGPAILVFVEITSGIICACIPTMGVLIKSPGSKQSSAANSEGYILSQRRGKADLKSTDIDSDSTKNLNRSVDSCVP